MLPLMKLVNATNMTLKSAGLLQPLPILSQVWEDITMNFIDELPKSNIYDTIMVIVDRLTKYSHFLPLKHPCTTSQVTTLFVREIVRLHGYPRTIVSN